MPDTVTKRKHESATYAYGGWFDLINQQVDIEGVKFAALFYDHIRVPDGFFHCYGPLFHHFRRLAAKPLDEQDNDPVVTLLSERVVVPTLRSGVSVFENWWNRTDGVENYLVVSREDGEDALRLVDRATKRTEVWPASMAPSGQSRYHMALERVFLNENSPYYLGERPEPRGLPADLHWEWRQSEDILDGFGSFLTRKKQDPHFRRGQVENFLAAKLGINFTSYNVVSERVDFDQPFRDLQAAVVYYLLSIASTAYEAFQASSFGATGGLFPFHDHPVIGMGVYDDLTSLSVASPAIQEKRFVPASLDTRELTISQIIRFRKEAVDKNGNKLFERYLAGLAALEDPGDNHSFVEAEPNQRFVTFVTNEYVPGILAYLPTVRLVKPATEFIGDGSTLGGMFGAGVFEGAELFGVPVAIVLSATGVGLRRSAPYLAMLADYLRAKRYRDRFERSNYTLWREKRPSDGSATTA